MNGPVLETDKSSTSSLLRRSPHALSESLTFFSLLALSSRRATDGELECEVRRRVARLVLTLDFIIEVHVSFPFLLCYPRTSYLRFPLFSFPPLLFLYGFFPNFRFIFSPRANQWLRSSSVGRPGDQSICLFNRLYCSFFLQSVVSRWSCEELMCEN